MADPYDPSYISSDINAQAQYQQDLKHYAALASSRLNGMSWYKQDPTTAAYLSSSKLPEQHVNALAQYYPSVDEWANNNTALGGVPGALRLAYLKALRLPGYASRPAIITLDSLRSLDSNAQNAFVAWLNNKPTDAFRTAAHPTPVREALARALGTTPGEIEYEGKGTFGVHGQDVPTDYVAALMEEFPQLRGKVHFAADGITLQDLKDSYDALQYNRIARISQGWKQHGLGGALLGTAETAGEVGAPIAGALFAPEAEAGIISTTGALAGLGVSGGLSAGSQYFEGTATPGGGSPFAAAMHVAGMGFRSFDRAMGAAAYGVGTVITAGKGSKEARNVVGSLALAVVLHEAGVAQRSYLGQLKVVNPDLVPEIDETTGKLVTMPGEKNPVVGPIDSAKAVYERVGATGAGIHPFRTFLDPAVESLSRKFAEFGPTSKFFRNRFFGKFYDWAETNSAKYDTFSEYKQAAINKWGTDAGYQAGILYKVPKNEMADVLSRNMERPGSVLSKRADATMQAHNETLRAVQDMQQTQRGIERGEIGAHFGNALADAETGEEMGASGLPASEERWLEVADEDMLREELHFRYELSDQVLEGMDLQDLKDAYRNHATYADLDDGSQASFERTQASGLEAAKNQGWGDLADENGLYHQRTEIKAPTNQPEEWGGDYTYHSYYKFDPATGDPQGVISFVVNRTLYGDDLPHAISAYTKPELQGQGIASSIGLRILQDFQDEGLSYKGFKDTIENEALSKGGRALTNKMAQKYLEDLEAKEAEANAARQAAVEQMNADPKQYFTRIPGHTLPEFLHRAIFAPESPLEHVVRTIFSLGRSGKGTKALTFVDKIRFETGLRSIDSAEAVARNSEGRLTAKAAANDILDKNTKYLGYLLNEFNISPEEARPFIGQVNHLTGEAWNKYVRTEIFGSKGLLSRHIPRGADPELVDDLLGTTWNETQHTTNTIGLIDQTGRSHLEPVRPDDPLLGSLGSKPFLPSEFRQQVPFPSRETIDGVLSSIRRGADSLGKGGHMGYELAHIALGGTRAVLMPLTLIANIPAIVLLKTLDESLGNRLMGDVVSPVRAPKKVRQQFGGLDPGVVANSMGQALDSTMGEATTAEVYAADVLRGKRSQTAMWQGLLDRMNKYRTDPLARAIATEGLDAKAAARMYTRLADPALDPEWYSYRQKYLSDMDDSQLLDTIKRQQLAIKDATFGGHDNFLHFITNDHLITGDGVIDPKAITTDSTRDYASLSADAEAIRGELRGQNLRKVARDPEQLAHHNALQAQLRSKLLRMGQIRDSFLENGGDISKLGQDQWLGSHEENAIIEYMRKLWNQGEIDLPHVMRVKKYTIDTENRGFMDAVKGVVAKLNELSYRVPGGGLAIIGRAEGALAKGAFWEQKALALKEQYIREGIPAADALALARLRATDLAGDYFYDLNARSTLERQTRNFFWFAPVSGELWYRWMYAIPAEQGNWLTGMALTSARLDNYFHLLRDTGLVAQVEDPRTGKKEWAVTIPGAAKLVNFLSGGQLEKGKWDIHVPLTSMFHITQRALPLLAPLPAVGLNNAAQHIPALRGISNQISPFGDMPIVPNTVRSLAGAFGINIPDISPGYVKTMWDKTHDRALQYAYVYLDKQGIHQPQPEDFGIQTGPKGLEGTEAQQNKYKAAWTKWFTRLQGEAEHMARGLYTVNFLSAAVVPGTLEYSSEEERAYSTWYNTHIAPQLVHGSSQSQAMLELQQRYAARHPESATFAISYNKYTGKKVPPTMDLSDPTDARMAYLEGIKQTMSPEEYARTLVGMKMKQHYDGQLNAHLGNIAGQGSVGQQLVSTLKNWGSRRLAVSQHATDWENYLNLTTDWNIRETIDSHTNALHAAYGYPEKSLQAQYVTQALSAASQVAGYFLGENGSATDPYKQFVTALKAAQAETYQKFNGGKQSPLTTGLNYFFDNVMSPYFKESAPIWQRIDRAKQAGVPSSQLQPEYNKLSALERKYAGKTYAGQALPSPSEFLYNSKSRQEQQWTRIHWASEDLSWLTPFARTTLGLPAETELWKQIGHLDAQVNEAENALKAAGKSLSSEAQAKFDAAVQAHEIQMAAPYGGAAVREVKLNQASPATRILNLDAVARSNQPFRSLVTQANEVAAAIEGVDYGLKTKVEVAAKGILYQKVQEAELANPDFKELMSNISQSMLIQGQHPLGVDLYEALFFGNFVPQFISPELRANQSVAPGVI